MVYMQDYEVTIKADMSDVPYWTCLRKGEPCNNLTIEELELLLKMMVKTCTRMHNTIARLKEIENSD